MQSTVNANSTWRICSMNFANNNWLIPDILGWSKTVDCLWFMGFARKSWLICVLLGSPQTVDSFVIYAKGFANTSSRICVLWGWSTTVDSFVYYGVGYKQLTHLWFKGFIISSWPICVLMASPTTSWLICVLWGLSKTVDAFVIYGVCQKQLTHFYIWDLPTTVDPLVHYRVGQQHLTHMSTMGLAIFVFYGRDAG